MAKRFPELSEQGILIVNTINLYTTFQIPNFFSCPDQNLEVELKSQTQQL